MAALRGARREHALRHPYDKRRYLAPLLVLAASIGAAFAVFYTLGLFQATIPNGSAVPASDETYALTDRQSRNDAHTRTATVVLSGDRAFALAVVRSAQGAVDVRADGVELQRMEGRLGDLRQVSVYRLDFPQTAGADGSPGGGAATRAAGETGASGASPVPTGADATADAGPRMVTIEATAPRWTGSDELYVGSVDALYDSFYLLSHGMKICALTMLAVMVFYALSLLLAKRSETYLVPFVAYTAFLIFWISLANIPNPTFLPAPVFNFVQVCGHFYVAYIPTAICVLLAGVDLPRILRPFTRWYCLLFVPALLGTAAYFGNFGATMGALTAFCLAFAGWALVKSRALGHPGITVLIAGFGITMGFKFAAVLVDVGILADSIVLYTMRKARLLNVPVVIAVMLYLNQTFARNFQKTEDTNALLETMVEQRTATLRKQQSMRLGMMVNIFHDLRSPLFTIQKCVEALAEPAAGREQKQSGPATKREPAAAERGASAQAPAVEAQRQASDGRDGTDGGQGEGHGRRTPPRDGQAAIVDILANRTAFLARLIEDLFTAAKLEDDDCLLAEDPVDIGRELREAVTACQALADERRVRMRLTCGSGSGDGADPLVTWGDRRYLSRAFENLLTNALQHAPAESVVEVAVVRRGASACVSVHNDGEPIAPDALPHVFERYYQRNTKAPKGSSGIGLSIVHAVAQRHRGEVGVASTAQEGTTFTMTLPLVDGAAPRA